MNPKSISALTLTAACLTCQAAVSPATPPVNYTGNVSFSALVNHNVVLNVLGGAPATAQVLVGADLQGYLWSSNDSVAHWHGGQIATYLQADGRGEIHVYGQGLQLMLVGPHATGQLYQLSGLLEDGQALNINAYTYSQGRFVLHNAPVPEPATWALMICGLGMLAAGKRRETAAG